MKHTIWLSFDLGIQGDYEGMYRWLDGRGARECGDGLAWLQFETKRELATAIKEDIQRRVLLDERKSRIYLIRLVEGKMKGTFIFGRRRNAPWAGTAEIENSVEDLGG